MVYDAFGMLRWDWDLMPSGILGAASALLGVAVGGYFTLHSQKRERQQRRISEQLAEFYSPMLALRAQVLAKIELRLRIAGGADSAWRAKVDLAYKSKEAIDQVDRLTKERFPDFEKITDYDNRQLAQEIIPAYRKMLELFALRMHLAEFSTIQHFQALLDFVEIWSQLRIPGEADQRSEVMAITIPNSCRSRFRDDGDHCSDGKPISFWRSSEWRSASSESFS